MNPWLLGELLGRGQDQAREDRTRGHGVSTRFAADDGMTVCCLGPEPEVAGSLHAPNPGLLAPRRGIDGID